MTTEITQTERMTTEKICISLNVFVNGDVILGVSNIGLSIDVHMKYSDLVSLGDAIQRIIRGARNPSENGRSDIVVGS